MKSYVGKHTESGMKKVGFWLDPTLLPPRMTTNKGKLPILTTLFVGILAVAVQESMATPSDSRDTAWSYDQRHLVIRYLKAGRVHKVWMGDSWCRCGCKHAQMGNKDLTDGVYLWPEGYAHYLEVHDVRPPDEFIHHVLMQTARGMHA